MKCIATTARVEYVESHKQFRDALSQGCTKFLAAVGCVPIIVPNVITSVADFLGPLPISGVLLTGGGNLASISTTDVHPEREETERQLLDYARAKKIPVLGICRGMQTICAAFGWISKPIDKHVGTRHTIDIVPDTLLSKACGSSYEVNSFHSFAPLLTEQTSDLIPIAIADSHAEAVMHRSEPLYGIMWHPECELPLRKPELDYVTAIFNQHCS